jgi:undecaprenyl-diphosphatase
MSELLRLADGNDNSGQPSGHTASAFAPATAVGTVLPPASVPLGLFACAVGYSRVHTGVHCPGDVIAGAVLGSACASLVLAMGRKVLVSGGRG